MVTVFEHWWHLEPEKKTSIIFVRSYLTRIRLKISALLSLNAEFKIIFGKMVKQKCNCKRCV